MTPGSQLTTLFGFIQLQLHLNERSPANQAWLLDLSLAEEEM
jgi:hypothetical protein